MLPRLARASPGNTALLVARATVLRGISGFFPGLSSTAAGIQEGKTDFSGNCPLFFSKILAGAQRRSLMALVGSSFPSAPAVRETKAGSLFIDANTASTRASIISLLRTAS